MFVCVIRTVREKSGSFPLLHLQSSVGEVHSKRLIYSTVDLRFVFGQRLSLANHDPCHTEPTENNGCQSHRIAPMPYSVVA
jgi:hypothetical protein